MEYGLGLNLLLLPPKSPLAEKAPGGVVKDRGVLEKSTGSVCSTFLVLLLVGLPPSPFDDCSLLTTELPRKLLDLKK